MVGFRLGSYIDGSVEVGSVSDLPHIPDNMKQSAQVRIVLFWLFW